MCVDLRLDQQLDAAPAKAASLYAGLNSARRKSSGLLNSSSEATRALLGCHYLSGVWVTTSPPFLEHYQLTGFGKASLPR